MLHQIAEYRRVVLVALLVVGAGWLWCSEDGGSRRRVLLIGIDGATLRVTRPMMEEGGLPNLSDIARDGVAGPLRSFLPLLSPQIWNSIATGKTPAKHGIVQFVRKDDDGALRLFRSDDRKVHALWNIVSDAGRIADVVNWWNTYPPERIRGVMVSDHLFVTEIEGRRRIGGAVSAPTGPVVFPESWLPKLSALAEEGDIPVPFENPFFGNEQLPAWVLGNHLTRWFLQDGAVVRFALEVEASNHPDLLMVLLTGIDRVSHALWGNLEPADLYPEMLRPSPSERAAGVAALRRYYEYTDALIGALLERYGPDDLVMVVSDHGFEAGIQLDNLTGVHVSEKALDGVIFARGSGIPRGGSSGDASVYDIAPTILAWMGLPVGMDMDGKVAAFIGMSTVERVATHDTGPIERISTEPSGVNDALIEQLRALGYVE
ncbi:alkaline phosphatase family protein [bacterium]|nr:alkaline phosphatase family protein [bacterium]